MFDESQHPRDHSGRWAASQAFTDAANAHVDQAEARTRRIGRMFVRRARQEYAFLRNGKSGGDEEGRAADASTAVSHAVSDVVPGPMLPLFAGDVADAVAEKMAGGAPGAEITDEVWADAVHEARAEAAQNEAYDVGLKAIPKKYQRHIEKHEEEIASQLQENGRIDHAKAFARKSIQADTNMSDKAVILCARGTSPFAKIEADRLKVGDAEVGIYRLRKEIIPLGESRVHPVKGYPIHVTRDRADGWVKNFRLMLDRGRSVPAPDKHKDAGENYGKWLDLSIAPNGRGGDSLFGTLQVYGDQTLEKVLNKDVSICTKEDVADDKGNTYEGEVCDHISVTAFPAISDLSGWTSIAASRGESIDVPVFELSATQESIMDLKALRTALGAAENVSDADILTQAAAKITGIPAAVTAATQPIAAERDTIKTERDGLKLELDRRPAAKQLDGELARERRLRVADKIKAIGGTPEWTKRATEVLCGTAQTPNTLMLDRASDTADDVRAMDYLQLVADFKPAKTGGGISGAQIIDADRRIPDDDNKAADLKSEKEQAEQWKKDRLAERGIA